MEFKFRISETVSKCVTVEAENAESARQIVEREYAGGMYDLEKDCEITADIALENPHTSGGQYA